MTTYLIDGYNLMHAVGLLGQGTPPGGLDRARLRLLDWLADTTAGRRCTLRVIFDAHAAREPSQESTHRGVRIRFAFRQTADELIEILLATVSHPKRVTVVSNDHQVRDAARRRGSAALTCSEFVDWCITQPVKPDASQTGGSPQLTQPEKPEPTTNPDETATWLAAFSQPRPNRRKR